jgi:hypothetical protein
VGKISTSSFQAKMEKRSGASEEREKGKEWKIVFI